MSSSFSSLDKYLNQHGPHSTYGSPSTVFIYPIVKEMTDGFAWPSMSVEMAMRSIMGNEEYNEYIKTM